MPEIRSEPSGPPPGILIHLAIAAGVMFLATAEVPIPLLTLSGPTGSKALWILGEAPLAGLPFLLSFTIACYGWCHRRNPRPNNKPGPRDTSERGQRLERYGLWIVGTGIAVSFLASLYGPAFRSGGFLAVYLVTAIEVLVMAAVVVGFGLSFAIAILAADQVARFKQEDARERAELERAKANALVVTRPKIEPENPALVRRIPRVGDRRAVVRQLLNEWDATITERVVSRLYAQVRRFDDHIEIKAVFVEERITNVPAWLIAELHQLVADEEEI